MSRCQVLKAFCSGAPGPSRQTGEPGKEGRETNPSTYHVFEPSGQSRQNTCKRSAFCGRGCLFHSYFCRMSLATCIVNNSKFSQKNVSSISAALISLFLATRRRLRATGKGLKIEQLHQLAIENHTGHERSMTRRKYRCLHLQVSSVGSVPQEKYGGRICNPKKMDAEHLNMMNTRESSASANAMICNDHNFTSRYIDTYQTFLS